MKRSKGALELSEIMSSVYLHKCSTVGLLKSLAAQESVAGKMKFSPEFSVSWRVNLGLFKMIMTSKRDAEPACGSNVEITKA
jgi:hypothetical protein